MPWQPRRAARIWDAALRGPLTWLGIVTWDTPARVARVAARDTVLPPDLPAHAILPTEQDAAVDPAAAAPPAVARWQYGAPGALHIPHTGNPAAVLRLLPFADWVAADATHSTYQVTPGTLARAAGQGWSDTVLRHLLQQHAGPPPDGWIGALETARSRLRLIQTTVIVADDPTVLDRAAQQRSVRRALDTRIAPGIALASPAQVPGLMRALARQDLVLEPLTDHPGPELRLPGGVPLSAAACADLLLAGASRMQNAACSMQNVALRATTCATRNVTIAYRQRSAGIRMGGFSSLSILHCPLSITPRRPSRSCRAVGCMCSLTRVSRW